MTIKKQACDKLVNYISYDFPSNLGANPNVVGAISIVLVDVIVQVQLQ